MPNVLKVVVINELKKNEYKKNKIIFKSYDFVVISKVVFMILGIFIIKHFILYIILKFG